MELEITTSIYIDIDYVIEYYNIDDNTSLEDLQRVVDEYVVGMDDRDFFLIGADEKAKIIGAIQEKIGAQMSLFND